MMPKKKLLTIKRFAVLFSDGSMNVYSDKFSRSKSLRMARDECADANENTKLVRDRARVVELEGQLALLDMP